MSRLALSLVVAMACACARTSEEPAVVPGASCGDGPSIAGVCVGVSSAPICAGDVCAEGASCARVVTVSGQAALEAAASAASSGECIAILPGKYGSISIPSGVSLLGRGAGEVALESVAVTLGPSSATLVRGLSVGAIEARGSGTLTLDRVRVDGSTSVGVRSERASVTIVQSTIASSASAGVLVDCPEPCAVRPKLSIERTWIHDAHRVSVLAFGIDAAMREVVVERTHAEGFLFGRGVEVSTGGTLQASRLRIVDSEDAGLVVDGSAALLGPELEVRNALRGIWLSEIPDGGVLLDGFVVEDAAVSGLGFDAGALGIVVRNGSIHATRSMNVPVDVGGSRAVGDGIRWGPGVHAIVESSVHVAASERLPALVDANAHGSFAATLEEGDEEKGVFLVNGSAHPDLVIGAGLKVSYGEPGSPSGAGKTPAP
jgi:hypothetical protein